MKFFAHHRPAHGQFRPATSRLLRELVLCVVALERPGAPAYASRLGSFDGLFHSAPIVEPPGFHSFILDNNNNQIFDTELASYFFTNAATRFDNYFSMIYTIEACESGGFIGDLVTIDGNEANIGVEANLRKRVAANTSAAWPYGSYYNPGTAAANYTDAFSWFPRHWTNAVDAPHPLNDTLHPAFDAGSAGTLGEFNAAGGQARCGGPFQEPQYGSSATPGNLFMDEEETLQTALPGVTDWAFLFGVGGANDVGWEFFRDIEFMRDTLINDYGWDDAHIIALYGTGPGGTLPDGVTAVPAWVDAAATEAALINQMTNTTHGTTTDLSTIVWFSTSHGSHVPEPGTLLLAAVGALGLGIFGWRRSRRTRPK